MNREFLKTVLSSFKDGEWTYSEEDQYDKHFREHNKDIKEQDILESVREVMDESPMKLLKDNEKGLVYQHPDLPVFYLKFIPKENKIYIASYIAPKDFPPSYESRFKIKDAIIHPTDLESLYEAIDKVSYVTKEDVKKLPEPRSTSFKEAIEYFLENSWL